MSREGSGALFRNKRKEKSTQPDRTGSCMVGGVEYWVDGWIKEGKDGQFLSLAFKRKDKQEAPKVGLGDDGPIPF